MIERLSDDLEDSELQFSTALQAHLIHIKNLAALQDTKCHALLNNFDFEKVFLEQLFNLERAAIVATHTKNKKDVYGVLTRLEKDYVNSESNLKHEWHSAREDIKNKVLF